MVGDTNEGVINIPSGPSIEADGGLDIIISDDQQSAYAALHAPQNGSVDVTEIEVIDLLAKKHVIYGLLEDAIRELVQSREYGKMKLVARGDLPVPGSDASIDYHVELSNDLKPRERDDGTVDYRDLGLITSVQAGDRLCTLTPAVKGTVGHTVTGRPLLPPSVRNLNLPAGKNTTLSEDRLTLLAAINGCVDWQNGRLSVLNLFTIRGDVGNSTGNVDFDGSVFVSGDVTSGFTVKATGNIDVLGHVEGAKIIAGGDIKLMGGFAGQGRGAAECGGNFKALFIENAEVNARGDITADVVMHSRVKCGGSLVVSGRRGAIIGGYSVVARDVKAMVVGTPNGIVTTLELGTDPSRVDRIKVIDERIRVIKIEMDKLTQIVQLLTPMMEVGKLPPERQDMLLKAIATHETREQELNELTNERETLRQEMELYANCQLVCRKELYAGTRIAIGSVPYAVTDNLMRCRVYLNQQREIALVSV